MTFFPNSHHNHHRRGQELAQDLIFDRSSIDLDLANVLVPRAPQTGSSDDFGAAPGETASGGGGGGTGTGSSSPSDTSSSPSSSSKSPSSFVSDVDNSQTVAIALGVILPVVFIIVTLLVVWRIVKKRQRIEEANDKHASLDFGLGEVSRNMSEKKSGKKRKGGSPEMMDLAAEKAFRKGRGMSMDMGSPYVLPGELPDGRPSFNSFSAPDVEDPYRPVTLIRSESPSAAPSVFSSRPGSRKDTASVWTQSSDTTSHGMKSDLIKHAQMPSRNSPPGSSTAETPPLGPHKSTTSALFPPDPSAQSFNVARKPIGTSPVMEETKSALDAQFESATHVETSGYGLGLHQSQEPAATGAQQNKFDFNLPTIQNLPDLSENDLPSFRFTEAAEDISTRPPPPPRKSSARRSPSIPAKHESRPQFDDYTTYADVLGIAQTGHDDRVVSDQGLGVQGFDMNARRLSASIRPLPPDDLSDHPETRANRIRSFYKEYFDDSKRDARWTGGYGANDYYEDYSQEYLNDATFTDPVTGQFIVSGAPYAQPVTRRAMTPPPRAPPRFGRGSNNSNRLHGSGQYGPRRPRGYSTASAQGPRGRKTKRPLVPPSPLSNLPTPHMLRDDSAIFNATDFAPPITYRDRVAGRPESPRVGQRPYSPSVRPFTPLASSFDDLRAMPSPHALRKSSTFTGLDFAPPPRINGDTGSDAGSIRSGRSHTSASQLANIRAGAYRVSRVPKEFVGTKDDFATALRPTWDQRGPGGF